MVDLLCAQQVVRVASSICEMASERVHWKRFLAPEGGAPSLTVRRLPALEGTAIDAPLGKCTFNLSADSLDDAVALAKGCPQLASNGGIEVYETMEVM